MGLIVASKAFFKLLFDKNLSSSFDQWAQSGGAPKLEAPAKEPTTAKPTRPAKPTRSDALTLLSTLQREARLIDIVKEPLTGYSDAQVGAAARDVLSNTGKVLDRMFDLQPLTDQEDGSDLETPAQFDANRFRLTGNISGDPPYKGKVAHHGWEARRCQVPEWGGQEDAAKIVAPIELQL